jgi:hypothetical protein
MHSSERYYLFFATTNPAENFASAINDGAKITGLALFSRKLRASFAKGRFD